MKNEEVSRKSDRGTFGVFVQLKIPEKASMDPKIGSENTNNRKTNNTSKRVCHFCLKEFNSGKALGGHMRIHVQQPPNNKYDIVDPNNNKGIKTQVIVDDFATPNCVICGKNFPSWKSLYGHMRCHPGRTWKGINPPSFSPSSTSCSSLSEIDPKVDNDDGYYKNIGTFLASSEINRAPAVDLAVSLKSWPVTAERGRKATTAATAAASSEVSSSVDNELLDAVNHLLMLSRGKEKRDAREFRNADIFLSEGKVSADELIVGARELMNEGELNESGNKSKKRKKKKMKLCDLESSKNVSPVVADKYKCDVCDKSFSSHQALGGHRSSHNKLKIVIINSNASVPSSKASPICRRGLEFDLNEVPTTSGFESDQLFTC